MQLAFNPVDYHFEWTSDGWYSWDKAAAVKAARKARDEAARRLKAEGRDVHKWSLPGQRITRGGIGSGNPEVDFHATVYYLNA
jgi:hypothetical protein